MSFSPSRRDYYAPRDHSEPEDGEIERDMRPSAKRRKHRPDDYYYEYEDTNRHRDRHSSSSRTDRSRHSHRPHSQSRDPSDVRREEYRSSSHSRREEVRHRSRRKGEHSDHRNRRRHGTARDEDRDEKEHKLLEEEDLRNRIKKRHHQHHEHIDSEKEEKNRPMDETETRDSFPSHATTPAADPTPDPTPDEVRPVIKSTVALIHSEDIDLTDDEHNGVAPADHVDDKPDSRRQSPDNCEPLSDSTPQHEVIPVEDTSSEMLGGEERLVPQIRTYFPAIQGCRNVEEFHCMNRIEEGTYGIVFRAKCKKTGTIVALKRLKMEKEKEGFPITSLREINTLMKSPHENIVRVMEIVVGSNMDKIYIVMEFVEHDLKSLMDQMKKPFLAGEVKTLMMQLLSAIAHLHDNWILHRDLKTSNLLLSHRGVLKVGDFGLAREYGSPLKEYTPVVVTLWYRAPELLLETPKYSTPIDVWSIGCIFGELLTMKPFFPGKSEIDQLNLIFKDLGTPSDNVWPEYSSFPLVRKVSFPVQPYNNLNQRIRGDKLSKSGLDLMMRFLAYCPERRITASKALRHEYFRESPKPVETWAFPTWPARSEGSARPKKHSPKAPVGGQLADRMAGVNDDILMGNFRGPGFSLKF